MISRVQQSLLDRLSEILELTEDVRVGQHFDFLGFLCQDATGRSLAEIDDDELLAIVERHCADLRRRQSVVQRSA